MQMPVQALYTTAYHRIFHGGLDDEDRRNLGADAPYHRRRRISFLTHTRTRDAKQARLRGITADVGVARQRPQGAACSDDGNDGGGGWGVL
jgi:hypothetical protein